MDDERKSPAPTGEFTLRTKGITAMLARIGIVGIVLYLCYRVVQPFVISLLWGVSLTVVFWPVNVWLRRRVRFRGVNALLSTLLVCLLIVAPAMYLGAALVDEIVGLSAQMEAGPLRAELDRLLNLPQTPLFKQIAERLKPWVDVSALEVRALVMDNLRRLAAYAVDRTTRLLANSSVFLLDLGVIVLTLFFLFRDGDVLLRQVKDGIPLESGRTEAMFSHLSDVLRTALYGGVFVAALQGFVGGLAFAVLGLAAPTFWGVLMGLCSFIPVFGAALVYVPAAVVLFLQGSTGKALILMSLGFGVVSTIDNLARPLVIGGRTQMHTLLLFVAIIGGLRVFGVLGLIMGPVLAAVFISLFSLYLSEIRRARSIPEAPVATDPRQPTRTG
jgi:predicted PurR-regulated permease PerM